LLLCVDDVQADRAVLAGGDWAAPAGGDRAAPAGGDRAAPAGGYCTGPVVGHQNTARSCYYYIPAAPVAEGRPWEQSYNSSKEDLDLEEELAEGQSTKADPTA
jgi:hypothetical protein